MAEQQSGLETWRYLSRSVIDRDSAEYYLPLILAGAGSLSVVPFAVFRFLNGEWQVGLLDSAIVLGFVMLGYLVYRTQRIRFASFALALLCVGGVLTTTYLGDLHQIYWAYPSLMAIFYLIKPREALALAVLLVAALLPAMLAEANGLQLTTLLTTIFVLCAFAYAFSTITNRQRQLLLQLATKDSLTDAGNRRALDDRLEEVVANFGRKPEPSSILLLDLDRFKDVNDRYGHAAGDEVLRQLAEILRMRIRVTDSMYRIGGEEFVILLQGESIERASRLAEQLRTLVEANELVDGMELTVSIGVAELETRETAAQWLNRADEAMYLAKRLGRNRTAAAGSL